MSPADSLMMSPGTSWSIGSSSQRLSLLVDHPQHGGGIADHRLQRIRRFGRARFLDEVEQREIPTIRAITPAANRSSVE
jgi:hypothetical protein